MRSLFRAVLAGAIVGGMALAPAAGASHNADLHSENMRLVGSSPKTGTTNSDLAFWGNLAFAGNYDGFRIIDISTPSAPQVVSDFDCPGSQGDVSVWADQNDSFKDLVFVSIDGPRTADTCGAPAGAGFEGIRIFDISDPANPQLVKGVTTDCGSHTHTLIPDLANGRVLLYVSSYPLGAPTADCNQATHSKISIVEVPLANPENASVLRETTPGELTTSIGCHDITVMLPLKLAAAACISEGNIWDISDPVNPTLRNKIVNPAIQIWHSAAFSWDGRTVAFGDEAGGAAAPGFCAVPVTQEGRIWFYDVASPTAPLGSFKIPRAQDPTELCTAHNFNYIPWRAHKLLVSAWYEGGSDVINADNPASAREVGFYDAQGPPSANTWSSYWYNGYIYANDIARGLDIFAFQSLAQQRAARFTRLNPQTQEHLFR